MSICCLTYNHVAFIGQALDSFLMQDTRFPIEVIVHDDASTDGTSEIVAKYAAERPDVFVVIRQPQNLYSQGVRAMTMRFMLPRARGKYIALCEGDDYWTDPQKLQIQVNELEAHPEYAGAFHETQQVMPDGTLGRVFGEKAPALMTAEDTFARVSPFHTSSLVFRHRVVEFPDWIAKVVSGDMAMFSVLTSRGPLKKVPRVMSVYRKHPGGITSSALVMDHFHERRIELMRYLNEFHGHKFDAKARQVIASHERDLAKAAGASGS